MARKSFKVVYSSLGRTGVWGVAHIGDDTVELEKTLKSKKHLEILMHEILHLVCPEMEEDDVVRHSVKMVNTLWREGYRRIDESPHPPLQDGTK